MPNSMFCGFLFLLFVNAEVKSVDSFYRLDGPKFALFRVLHAVLVNLYDDPVSFCVFKANILQAVSLMNYGNRNAKECF